MGCGPSAPLEDELETNVLRRRSSSEDDDYAASSPRSRERDVRHWKRVDVECRGASRPPPRGRAARIDIDPNLKPRRRVTFAEELDEVVIPPLSEISRALRLDVYWSGAEFDLMHRQRQRLSVEVARRAYVAGRNGGDAADLSPSANFAGESLRGLGLVDERHLGSIAQRQRPAVRARSRDFRRGPGLRDVRRGSSPETGRGDARDRVPAATPNRPPPPWRRRIVPVATPRRQIVKSCRPAATPDVPGDGSRATPRPGMVPTATRVVPDAGSRRRIVPDDGSRRRRGAGSSPEVAATPRRWMVPAATT